MPYLPDGTFVADMPAQGNVLAGSAPPPEGGGSFVPFDRRTGTPYRQFLPKTNTPTNVLKTPTAPKPGYAHLDVPEFPDYVKFAATRDGVDLSTADDKQLLGYAKEYSENMLPQALMAAGHKVDKEYLKTLTPNFQYKTAQSLPQLREYFKANVPALAPADAKSDNVLSTVKNVAKEIPAGLASGLGNQAAALVHGLQGDVTAPDFKFDPETLMALTNPAFALNKLKEFAQNKLAKQVPVYNETLDKIATTLSNSGRSVEEAIKESQTPAYKEDQKQTFLSGEPFIKEGKINPGYFNAKALNIAKLIGAPIEGVGEIAPALAATYATKSPLPIIASMGLSGAGRAWQEEENRLNSLPKEELESSPVYQSLIKDGYTPEGAKQALIYNSSSVQGEIGGSAGALTGVLAELPWLQKSAGGFLTRVAKNVLKQGSGFGAVAGAQQAASNVLRNEETGTNTPVSEGVGESIATGVAGALPFAAAGGFAKPGESAVAAPKAEAAKVTPEAPTPGAAPAAGNDVVQSSIAQAMQEHPVPQKEALSDPIAAKAHYDEALATFRGDLMGADVPPEQITAAQPAFDAAWREATGLDPATLGKAPESAPAAPETPLPPASAAELDTAAAAAPTELPAVPARSAIEELGLTEEPTPGAAAPVREESAADHIPEGLRNRLATEFLERNGREATPAEISTTAGHLFDIALSDPRIDGKIARPALEEAVAQLAEKSKELPSPKAINELARTLEKERVEVPSEQAPPVKDVLAKKAEAAPKDDGSLASERTEPLKEGEQIATKEEAAKLKPAEDYFRKFKTAGEAARDLASRMKTPYLQRALQLLMRNEHGLKTLDETPLNVRNPGELAKSPSGETVGHYITKEGEQKYRNTRLGVYNPKDGITLAGSGWSALNPMDVGVHPITFIHEALHAKLSGTLRAIENGDITQGSMIAAYKELEGIRTTLDTKRSELPISPEAKGSLNYALGKNIHEFLSVTLSDPRVQAALRDVTVGKVTLWQKVLGIINRLLGGTPQDMPILDRIFSLAEHIGDYNLETGKHEGPSLYSKTSERIENRNIDEVIKATDIKAPEKPTSEEIHNTPNAETRTEKATTKFLNSLAPLRRMNEFLARNKISVESKANMFDEATRFQNTSQRAAALAEQQYVSPMLNFFAIKAEQLGMTPVDFANAIKNWYTGKHALERNEFFELKKGRLTKEAEIARAEVLDKWNRGELPSGQLLEELRKIVNKPGARVANRAPLYDSGYSTEQAQAMISRARRAGITPEMIAEFEPLKKAAEQATIDNGLKARRFSAADEARRSGIGFKYYLPLKGFADAREFSSGNSPGAFTSEYTVAQGRESLAQNPILSLMQNVVRSARDTAENEFTKSIYNFAKKYGDKFGIRVKTYPIEDMIQKGGLEDLSKIYKNENVVIHNNGEYRYAIEFPKDSPAIKAIKEVTTPEEIGEVAKWFGKVSNFIGRGATTFSPRFLLWNNIWRDFLYNPTLMASDLGAKATIRYVKEYFGQGGPIGALKYYFKGLHPRNILEREQFAQNSSSPFAKDMALIAKYGGDLSFEHQLNAASRSVENLFNRLNDATKKTATAKDKLLAAQHFMDSVATVGMMATRRAAFRAYVDEAFAKIGKGITEEQKTQVYKDAALYSRRLLDYQQKSDIGRTLNAYWIFSRVALTHADRIAGLFRKEDGSYDYKKMAGTAGLMMAAGAAYYTLLKQSDPDGAKKLDNSTFATMLPIPIGDGKYLNVPAPYGPWRLGFVPGIMAARAFEGDSSAEDAANVVRNAYAENLSPLKLPEASHNEGFAEQMFDFLQAVTPTAVRPMADLAVNKNTFGDKITPAYPVKGPHSEISKSSTPESIKALAHGLAAIGVDVYPESLQYLLSQYGTGPVADLLRGVKMAENAVQGKETDLTKAPFMPNVINKDANYYEIRRISELREELERKDGTKEFTEQDKELLKRIRSSQSKYSKEVKAIEKNTLLTPSAKEKQIKDIRDKQKVEQAALIKEAERAK